MATCVKSHVVSLALCLIAAVTGSVLIVAALLNNGAEQGRFTQCFSSERMDLVVLPSSFPAAIDERPPTAHQLAKLRGIAGLNAVREVRGGPVHLFRAPPHGPGLQAVALPDSGLPMLPLIEGHLPASPSDIVLYQDTADRLNVGIGDTVTFASAKGTPVKLHVSGLIDVDMDARMMPRGTVGMSQQAAAQLFQPLELQGLQLTLDSGASPTAVRNAASAVLGTHYSVYTRQDIAARRAVDDQVTTIALAVLGLTFILTAVTVSCTMYGRLRESYVRPAEDVVDEHGKEPVRRLLAFDRLVGLVISAASGVAMAAGLMVLLASMGADLPCSSVMSMSGVAIVIPLAAYAFAMSTAPIPLLMKRRGGQ